jgi:hypothetical protein
LFIEISVFHLSPYFQRSGRSSNDSGKFSGRPTGTASDISQVAASFNPPKPAAVSPKPTPMPFERAAATPNAVTKSAPVAASPRENAQWMSA